MPGPEGVTTGLRRRCLPWLFLGCVLAMPPARAGAAPDPTLAAAAQAMADALDAELRQAEAVLGTAVAALDFGAPPRATAAGAATPALSLPTLDRLARAAAATLGLPVTGFDPRLAPLVDSTVPPGQPLPASPVAVLAADALETLRPVAGRLGDPGGGIGLAMPVLRGPGGRAAAVLVATIRPDRIATVMGRAAGAGLLLAARLVEAEAGTADPAAGETIAWARLELEAEAPGAELATTMQRLRREPRWAVLVTGRAPSPPLAAPPPEPPALPSDASPPGAATRLLGRLGLALGAGLFGAAAMAALLRRPSRRRTPGTAQRDAEEARRALAELRSICDTIPVGLALLDAGECRLLSANQRLCAFAGLPPGSMVGRRVADVLPPPLAEAIAAGHAQVLREGRPVVDAQIAVEAPGTLRHTRNLLVSCHPVRAATGVIEAVSAVVQDVTERARAEAGRELLVRELNHRVKNTLATVQSIAYQTVRGVGADLAGFERSFNARIRALARAHDLLTQNSWQEADLLAVARAALSPWLEDPRLKIDPGPEVLLRPSQAQALVLAFHELATNAAKHGALTRDEGVVSLHWSLDPDGVVLLRWTESGGPSPSGKPARRGFGMRLLEQALSQDLGAGAEPTLLFDPEGLHAAIRFRPGGVLPATRIAA